MTTEIKPIKQCVSVAGSEKVNESEKIHHPYREPHFRAQQFLVAEGNLHVTSHENSNRSKPDPSDNHKTT